MQLLTWKKQSRREGCWVPCAKYKDLDPISISRDSATKHSGSRCLHFAIDPGSLPFCTVFALSSFRSQSHGCPSPWNKCPQELRSWLLLGYPATGTEVGGTVPRDPQPPQAFLALRQRLEPLKSWLGEGREAPRCLLCLRAAPRSPGEAEGPALLHQPSAPGTGARAPLTGRAGGGGVDRGRWRRRQRGKHQRSRQRNVPGVSQPLRRDLLLACPHLGCPRRRRGKNRQLRGEGARFTPTPFPRARICALWGARTARGPPAPPAQHASRSPGPQTPLPRREGGGEGGALPRAHRRSRPG